MDLEDALSSLDIGRVDHDLPVEAARPQQRRIEDIGAVGGGDENHPVVGLESVHLHEELVEGLFAFVVAASETGAAVAADGVDFIDEDDAGRAFLALFEEIANSGGADTDEHLDEIGSRDREEGNIGLAGDGPGEQRLAGSRRTHEQHALGDLSAEPLELLRVLEKIDDLLELLLGLRDTGDILEGDLFLFRGEELGLGLAEGHGLGPAGLHLPEENEPEPDENEERRPRQERGEHPAIGGLFHLDDDVVFAQVVDEIVITGVVGEVVVARLRSVFLARHSGLDVDLFALDEDLVNLTCSDPVEEVRERDFATGGRVTSENLEDEHHPHNDHGPHEDSSYGLIHDPISSRRNPFGVGAKENLTKLPILPPLRSRTDREGWCAGCGSGRDRIR